MHGPARFFLLLRDLDIPVLGPRSGDPAALRSIEPHCVAQGSVYVSSRCIRLELCTVWRVEPRPAPPRLASSFCHSPSIWCEGLPDVVRGDRFARHHPSTRLGMIAPSHPRITPILHSSAHLDVDPPPPLSPLPSPLAPRFARARDPRSRLRHLVPRSRIAQAAPARTGASPAEVLRQVLGRNVLLQLLLVVLAEDVDLADGGFVEPGLDEGPDGGEEVRGLWRVSGARGA